jgi:hypothetical protein
MEQGRFADCCQLGARNVEAEQERQERHPAIAPPQRP